MSKTTNLYIRIEPELKAAAEAMLEQLGITTSNAVNVFFKQVVLHQGLPFEVKLPSSPLDINQMTKAQIEAELLKGYEDYLQNRVKSQDIVVHELNDLYDK